MKNILLKTAASSALIFTLLSVNAQNTLTNCWNENIKPINSKYITFSYTEKLNNLGHNFEPWQQTKYRGNGNIWTSSNAFLKDDTLTRRKRTYFSCTVYNENELLFLDYGDKDLFPVTKDLFLDQFFKTARYTPINLINYFFQNEIDENSLLNSDLTSYTTVINKTVVTLYINKKDNLPNKITTLSDDELYGDVLTTFSYSEFEKIGTISHPTKVLIDKYNGNVIDEVLISNLHFDKTAPLLLEKPVDYGFSSKEEKAEVDINSEKYNNNIHLIELKHTDDRIMVVEFSDFLLVAEAPLSSENGALIIAEAEKIAPNKPIKYFVFGHHHPHYLGGVRPFVHLGAKIICSNANKKYLKDIVNAPRTLNPDILQKEPKTLKIELIKDSLTISDNDFKMKIYLIGEKSEHTSDYLIYYFPKEKLLFQDDLIWIKKEGEIKKAGRRQAGIYNAIMELDLEVETIIQSWPVNNHKVKTIIPFSDLEKSMSIEK